MPDPKQSPIDDYISGFPPNIQERLEKIRGLIKAVEPDAAEIISYQMAATKLHGYVLVYFAAHEHHIGLYPAPVDDPNFPGDLSAYASGKGTVRFPHDQPLPLDLIKQIVTYRAEQNAARAAEKMTKKRKSSN
ncbi:MAG: DUF1801 domain-containing protein [Anaerolineaceae bacterium]|nr:DUF1801 domain-containing protein [Anaerolineaceae bacterium]